MGRTTKTRVLASSCCSTYCQPPRAVTNCIVRASGQHYQSPSPKSLRLLESKDFITLVGSDMKRSGYAWKG